MLCGLYSVTTNRESSSRLVYLLYSSMNGPVTAELKSTDIDWRTTKISRHLEQGSNKSSSEIGCKTVIGHACTLDMIAANDTTLFMGGGTLQYTLTSANTSRVYSFDLTDFAEALTALHVYQRSPP